MDCGLPGQSEVLALCPVAFQSLGKGRSFRRRERLPAPGAAARPDRRLLHFRSAQFEHTVVITAKGAQILTQLPHEA